MGLSERPAGLGGVREIHDATHGPGPDRSGICRAGAGEMVGRYNGASLPVEGEGIGYNLPGELGRSPRTTAFTDPKAAGPATTLHHPEEEVTRPEPVTNIGDNCTLRNENHIHIGCQVLIAPNVQFYTATHPINWEERFVANWDEDSGELFFRTRALPITIGDRVWIGGGSIILPGVTISEGGVTTKKFYEWVSDRMRYDDVRSFGLLPFMKQLNIKTCCYCNAQYATTFINGNDSLASYDLDHYYPQSKYPYLSTSFLILFQVVDAAIDIKVIVMISAIRFM